MSVEPEGQSQRSPYWRSLATSSASARGARCTRRQAAKPASIGCGALQGVTEQLDVNPRAFTWTVRLRTDLRWPTRVIGQLSWLHATILSMADLVLHASNSAIDGAMLQATIWMTVATWLAGLGTVATLAYAVTASARTAKRQQALDARQAELDERHAAADERDRDRWARESEQDRRAQAERIAVWSETVGSRPRAVISNFSDAPIWDALVSWGISNRSEAETVLRGEGTSVGVPILPPGRHLTEMPPLSEGGQMHTMMGLAITFRDSAGRFWQRDARGALNEVESEPIVALREYNPYGNWKSFYPYPQSG